MTPTRLQTIAGSTVTCIWVVTLIWRAINDHATDFASVDSTVLLAFGFLFAADAIRIKRHDDHNTPGGGS